MPRLLLQLHASGNLPYLSISARPASLTQRQDSGSDTIDVAMLGVHKHPVEPTTGNRPGMVASGQHLPGSESQAGASLQSLLESVRCLHFVDSGTKTKAGKCEGRLMRVTMKKYEVPDTVLEAFRSNVGDLSP